MRINFLLVNLIIILILTNTGFADDFRFSSSIEFNNDTLILKFYIKNFKDEKIVLPLSQWRFYGDNKSNIIDIGKQYLVNQIIYFPDKYKDLESSGLDFYGGYSTLFTPTFVIIEPKDSLTIIIKKEFKNLKELIDINSYYKFYCSIAFCDYDIFKEIFHTLDCNSYDATINKKKIEIILTKDISNITSVHRYLGYKYSNVCKMDNNRSDILKIGFIHLFESGCVLKLKK